MLENRGLHAAFLLKDMCLPNSLHKPRRAETAGQQMGTMFDSLLPNKMHAICAEPDDQGSDLG
jgi:hypothetical protein